MAAPAFPNLEASTGFRLFPTKHLEPRLERDTFSGGTNVSARERNLARIDESASKVYTMAGQRDPAGLFPSTPPRIIGSRYALALVARQVGGDAPPLRGRLHPAARAWYQRKGLL